VLPYGKRLFFAYAIHLVADVSCVYPSAHRLVPAFITWYRSVQLSVGNVDGADDIDGVKVVVVGRKEVEGSDDGVDDHDEGKGSQMGLKLSSLNPYSCVLK